MGVTMIDLWPVPLIYEATHATPPPPIHVYKHAAYLAGTSAPGSMRSDFRLYRIVVYVGGISAWLASANYRITW